MRICLVNNRVEQDRINPPPPADDGDLVAWKRVASTGYVKEGPVRHDFSLTLDLRARLMQVACEGVAAGRVGDALIHKMGEFILVPRSRLFMPSGSIGSQRFEWIVADAVHVSGLLHRLKEVKEFDEPQGPPLPPGLAAVRTRLLDSVAENTAKMKGWQEHRQQRQLLYYVRFDPHAWDLLRGEFLTLTDDPVLQHDFARFFAGVEGWERATQTLFDSPSPFEDPNPTRTVMGPAHGAHAWMNIQGDEAYRLGSQIVERYGTKEQQQRAAKKW
jgi:hypothetical protein